MKMELTTTAGLIKALGDIEEFEIMVNDRNYLKVKKKLAMERNKALEILRKLKDAGLIKSVSLPRNPELQKAIDRTVEFKRECLEGIEKIKDLF